MGYGTLSSSAISKIRLSSREFCEIILDWTVENTATGLGTVSLNIATPLMANHPDQFTTDYFGGLLYSVETVAGASGDLVTNRATTMSLTIKDKYGFDIMEAALANRSTAAGQIVYLEPPVLLNSDLQLNVASTQAVGAKGRVILWIEQ
jgi:hypothetical protein